MPHIQKVKVQRGSKVCFSLGLGAALEVRNLELESLFPLPSRGFSWNWNVYRVLMNLKRILFPTDRTWLQCCKNKEQLSLRFIQVACACVLCTFYQPDFCMFLHVLEGWRSTCDRPHHAKWALQCLSCKNRLLVNVHLVSFKHPWAGFAWERPPNATGRINPQQIYLERERCILWIDSE